MLTIKPEIEKNKIAVFLRGVFKKQKVENAVIGLSGGIDSATSFYLLKEVLPPENIYAAHLHYLTSHVETIKKMLLDAAKIPERNFFELSVKPSVDTLLETLSIDPVKERVRVGNIAARMRMIILFDLAKKHNALVCGTENKSENLLSYFTRFGDQASDIEPIEHLYKTQVYQLAEYLRVPMEIARKNPTADLWLGQTDEGEFGFTYKEADQVLYLYLENNVSVEELEKRGLRNARKILEWRNKNLFKHQTPYHL